MTGCGVGISQFVLWWLIGMIRVSVLVVEVRGDGERGRGNQNSVFPGAGCVGRFDPDILRKLRGHPDVVTIQQERISYGFSKEASTSDDSHCEVSSCDDDTNKEEAA
ncbi:hypothetical protein BJ165DRAFT_1400731 [Panaeolus papilionaceus]|nr:hypothetical protein BJ165DRAFT_1400731 [Panaeolus papilionaceus]